MKRMSLVIADDDPDVRLSLSVLLTGTDFFDVIGEASDGAEAIDACRRLHPDVLLLDLAMPVMDGYEALPIVRHACPDTKVIVYSGQAARVGRPRALELGAAGYIEKDGAVLGIWQEILEILGMSVPRGAGAGSGPGSGGRHRRGHHLGRRATGPVRRY